MKKITPKLLLLLMVASLFTSCASILNGKYQKVTVHTSSSDSKVYVNDELQGTGKSVTAKMKRDANVKQVRVERDGYKPVYKIHYQDRKSPLYIMSWVPFGVLFYPPLMDYAPKAFNYPKELSTSKDMLEIKNRTDDKRYVYLKNTAFDIKKEDIKFTQIKHRQLKKNKINKAKDKGKGTEDLKFDNSIFTDAVNQVLKDHNYVDTTNTIFKSNTNSLYISAKITKVEFGNVYAIAAKNYMNFLITKADIEWEIFDLYNQSKYKKTIKAESGEFSLDYDRESAFKNSLEDAITASFFKFLDAAEVQKLLPKEDTKEIKLETIKLSRPAVVSNLEDAMEATVTIKSKDGHGSGCFVTNDGYIVTNFHVVSGVEKITVITKDGKEYDGKVVRRNEYSDLALVKVEGNFSKAFTLPSSKNYKVGDDIFAIGTPKSIELGQSLSKGIISGFRTYEKNNLIQTDASVNGGNSGGALVNKNGEFIGVVNAKVFGVGVEGLGFSIPAETIFKDLSIAY
ncbi:serine protease [Flavobacterium zepuense]|uniref:Serine protease n=1 Tax=Flavobacterium zepuense TaxID=2593302 RepID=A0A552V7U7_9FLAO|nr:S1C family serine protease [Flavobacterium zepuense]TRW26541.1 serine protease [Flavobacterium zepuense]